MPIPSRQVRAEASQEPSITCRQVCRTMFLTCQLPGAGSGPPAMPDSQEVPPAGLSLSGPAKLCGLEGQARLFHSTQRPMCSGNSLAQAFSPPGLGSHQLCPRLIYLRNEPKTLVQWGFLAGVSVPEPQGSHGGYETRLRSRAFYTLPKACDVPCGLAPTAYITTDSVPPQGLCTCSSFYPESPSLTPPKTLTFSSRSKFKHPFLAGPSASLTEAALPHSLSQPFPCASDNP